MTCIFVCSNNLLLAMLCSTGLLIRWLVYYGGVFVRC
jgi:hypothetical protein